MLPIFTPFYSHFLKKVLYWQQAIASNEPVKLKCKHTCQARGLAAQTVFFSSAKGQITSQLRQCMMVAFFSRKQKIKFSQQCTQNYSIWNQHLLSRMEAIGSVPHHSKRSLSEMSLGQRVRRIRRGLLMSSVESFDKSLREDNRKITEKQ